MTEIDVDAAQAAARNIIETALKSLTDMGMEYENAASLLCIQGANRVESQEELEQLRDFIDRLLHGDGMLVPDDGNDETTH